MRKKPGLRIDQFTEPERENTKMWMLTFTDLVLLLLTIFVLLFAMSNVKIDEWDKVTDSLSQTLKPAPEENLSSDPLLKNALIVRLEDRLMIALPSDALFDPGAAVINERARDPMFTLGAMFANVGNAIGVTGNTDPDAPGGDAFASNWELSIAQAASVANAIRRGGYDGEIVALGYADSQYNRLPNLSNVDKRRLARRVDIIVMPTAETF